MFIENNNTKNGKKRNKKKKKIWYTFGSTPLRFTATSRLYYTAMKKLCT